MSDGSDSGLWDIGRLASSGTIATLLPGASFHRRRNIYPPARALIDSGAAVALGVPLPGVTVKLMPARALRSRATRRGTWRWAGRTW